MHPPQRAPSRVMAPACPRALLSTATAGGEAGDTAATLEFWGDEGRRCKGSKDGKMGFPSERKGSSRWSQTPRSWPPVQLRVRCIGSRRQTRQSSPPKIGLAPSLCAALPDPGQPRRDPKLMDPRASTL
jgi:hypothetical protein